MSEPVNALAMDKDKPPSCDCGDLKERVERLEDRLDHAERELALVTGKEDRGGFLSWILRKR